MTATPTSADLSQIRTDYKQATLDEAGAAAEPFGQFERWMNDALKAQAIEPTAMTVSTLDDAGFPEARIVLLKGYDARGFVFYTNYESAKGRELLRDPRCSLVFFWPELERQVRVVGRAAKTSKEESDAYFASRPRKSQIGAVASPQSRVISRADLDTKFAELDRTYPEGTPIPRPEHWGGFRVTPDRIEFWQGRRSRMHDRLRYIATNEQKGEWTRERLAP